MLILTTTILFPHPLKVTRLSLLVFIFAQLRKIHLLHSDDVKAISHCKELAFLGSNALLKNPSTGVIMLYDRSNSQTTQVYGENACKFETGRLRRVVVAENLNTKIGIGGQACDLTQFQLRWHNNADEILKNSLLGSCHMSWRTRALPGLWMKNGLPH